MHERQTDVDFWAKAGWIVDRFKIVWAFWIAVAAGAGWFSHKVVEPLNAIPHLMKQQDSLSVQMKAAEADRQDIKNVLKIAVKMLCAQTDASDRYKYGIDCAAIPVPDLRNSPTLTEPTVPRR